MFSDMMGGKFKDSSRQTVCAAIKNECKITNSETTCASFIFPLWNCTSITGKEFKSLPQAHAC